MAPSPLTGLGFAWQRVWRGKVLASVLFWGLVLADGVASAVLLLESVTARQGVEAQAGSLGQERFVRLSSTANGRADYDKWQSTARRGLARALAKQAAVLLADEPTGHPDSESGEEMARLLRSVAEGGTTVIAVTHDLALARRADRILRLEDGHLDLPAF